MSQPISRAACRALGIAALLGAAVLTFPAGTFRVTGIRALDGDSIVAKSSDGTEMEIRLLHVDAPEHGQPLSAEARAFTNSRIARNVLTLTAGEVTRDRYHRLLAFVEAEGRSVNLELIDSGLALAYLLPPNTSRADEYLAAQARAHSARKGIWGLSTQMEEPRSFRERKRNGLSGAGRMLLYENWEIAGNARSLVGHWPGCRHVDKISPSNRVCFASVKAALAKGYRMETGYK